MNLRRWTLAAAILFGLAAGAALAEPRDTIYVAMAADGKGMDPQMSNDTSSSTFLIQMYEPLFDFNADKELYGVLAESWEKLDDVTYQITLRKGVKFHNGDELTAEDAVFSLHRMTTPKAAAVKAYGSNIDPEGFKIIDRYTFQIKSAVPMGSFLSYLNHSSSYIMNKKAVEAAGDDYGREPIGTGPFKFVSTLKGDNMTFERFDDYWNKEALPKYKTLVIRVIPEATSRVIELETGNVDLAYGIPNSDFQRLKDEGVVNVYNKPGMSVTYMGFHTKTKPFDDPRVRHAISMAIDKVGANEVVYNGLAMIPTSPILPTNSYYVEDPALADEYDPDKAMELLKEAGYGDGFSFTLYTNENKQRQDYAVIIQNMMESLGITVDIQVLEWGYFLDQLKSGSLPVFIIGWAASNVNPDPGAFITAAMHSKFAGPSNRVWLDDPEVDRLLDAGMVTEDGPEREAIYVQFQKRINELLPWCYLSNPDTLYGTNKDLKGAEGFYRGTINCLNGIYYE